MSDVRPDRPAATGRALLVVAGLGAVVAIVLGVIAFRPSGDQVVLDATPATAVDTPVTLPLLPPPSSIPATTAPEETPATSITPDTTIPDLSPLAELLGVPGSAIPPALEPRVRPMSVTIDDIDVMGPVRAVGLRDDGQLEVPDATEIGWYQYGSSPGRPGATVLAAHVSWNGAIGPFHRLGSLAPGARVDVTLDDDTVRTYEVVERTIYDKDSLPRERIWRTTGDESLVLITCGGSFNPDISRFRQNIVVYAVPVA
jgi:Sortase domain